VESEATLQTSNWLFLKENGAYVAYRQTF